MVVHWLYKFKSICDIGRPVLATLVIDFYELVDDLAPLSLATNRVDVIADLKTCMVHPSRDYPLAESDAVNYLVLLEVKDNQVIQKLAFLLRGA